MVEMDFVITSFLKEILFCLLHTSFIVIEKCCKTFFLSPPTLSQILKQITWSEKTRLSQFQEKRRDLGYCFVETRLVLGLPESLMGWRSFYVVMSAVICKNWGSTWTARPGHYAKTSTAAAGCSINNVFGTMNCICITGPSRGDCRDHFWAQSGMKSG